MAGAKEWQVYVLRCGDGTYYTGVTVNMVQRLAAHTQGRGARYTRGRGPLLMWWLSAPMERSHAIREEARIKRLSHRQKEARAFGDHPQPVG